MILHRLRIEDFRGVRREEVEIPERGVLVIEGPNESGKTSLMDALEMLLEHKASSGRADVRAASPVGRDVPVVVEAEFTVEGERMRYRKEFVRGKRTTLEFPGSARAALSGDDAHDHVRDLLDRKVDRSLWRALRIAQDEPIGQVGVGRGMDSLRRALDSAGDGSDPTGDDSLVSRVEEERGRYLTARRGEPTAELARSESRLASATKALEAAQVRFAEVESAVTEHSVERTAHEGRTASLAAVDAQVELLEEVDRTVATLREAARVADSAVDHAASSYASAQRDHRERGDLIADRDHASNRLAELRASKDAAAERLEPAATRAHDARGALDTAEEDVARARARVDVARAQRDQARQRADLESLDALLTTLGDIGEELVKREADLAASALPIGSVESIRAADESLREAVVRSAASAPTVEVSGEGTVRVTGEAFEAADGWTSEIVEDTVFEIGGVALAVTPAGDTDAVRREVSAARSRLTALLEDSGVDSLAVAEERFRRAEIHRAEIAALKRRRTDLLGGDTAEDLHRHRDSLRAEVDSAPVATGGPAGDQAAVADPDALATAAEETVSRCRAKDRAAAAEAESCRTELATRIALYSDAETRLSTSEEGLAAARSVRGDESVARAEEESREVADSAREAAREARRLVDDALADAPPELLLNARASHSALVLEERKSAAAVATALGRVNAISDQGRHDDVTVADREVDSAQRENASLWRRARAADLLHRTLTARRSEALLAYQEPFHRAVVELGSLVYGRDFDVSLGEDLTVRTRRIGDVTVEYDGLSSGAREQLAMIVRIAVARLVGEDGVPVFLDDTMGYTDPVRRLAMGAVLAAAASTSQLIVLTCDRARFAGIGGAHTHVMRRMDPDRG